MAPYFYSHDALCACPRCEAPDEALKHIEDAPQGWQYAETTTEEDQEDDDLSFWDQLEDDDPDGDFGPPDSLYFNVD